MGAKSGRVRALHTISVYLAGRKLAAMQRFLGPEFRFVCPKESILTFFWPLKGAKPSKLPKFPPAAQLSGIV
jgi:hypothetical protein